MWLLVSISLAPDGKFKFIMPPHLDHVLVASRLLECLEAGLGRVALHVLPVHNDLNEIIEHNLKKNEVKYSLKITKSHVLIS